MWVDVEQNGPEWERLRIGRIGGSSAPKIMANYGKAFGDPAKRLSVKLALEQIDGEPRGAFDYHNDHMDRGHEQEPIARGLYSEETFSDVLRGGYYCGGDDTGCSPDGRVGAIGLVEIKSVIDTVHYATIDRGKFDPAYKWQLIWNLKVSGREWIDFVSFCSDFPSGKKLFIDRLHAKNLTAEFDMIDSRLKAFRELVLERKTKIINL